MSQVPATVQAVFERTRGELARRVQTLEETVAAMLEGKLDESLRANAERDAHKLAGSLGMFGLPRGSELARELEQALGVLDGPAPSEAPRLAELVLALRSQLDDAPVGSQDNGLAGPPLSDGRALLLVSPDPVLTKRLSVEALGRHLRPRSAASPAAARRLVVMEPPDAAVLDLSFSGADHDGLELLVDLVGAEPPVPVVVLTSSEALVDRVEVSRRGASGFIQRSRPASHVVDAVCETVERRDRAQAKLLAVDDDPAISQALAALLSPVGLEVATLNDPSRFWERLEAINPDLLVLDLDMPELDGIDLCRAVRADVRFGQLPVLFLTARVDAGSVERIFEAGADDYVSKPIFGPEIVTRIQNRLDRVHLYRELAETDSLTGIASRRKSTAALEDLIALADRLEQPLSIALIDLDHFKRLNDRLGHAAGDAALRQIGAMLAAAFRGEDVVGRWGGEEFVVGMYGMGRDDAIQRVAELLESFRAEQFTGRDGRCACLTFSAGVAEYPRDGPGLHDLCRAADEALYRAKADGRNRVLGAGSPRSASPEQPDPVVVEYDAASASLLVDPAG
ncbi:MAG: diguanylate cyclase [Actinomycetota bacterium]|nr:diguanylate cyclase [Actinomycetota bacterium]